MPRMMIRLPLLALALMSPLLAPLMSQAARAQESPPHPQTPPAQTAPPQTAPAQTAPDTPHLAAARQTVDHIFPVGTYARLMGAPMDKLMDSIMGGAGQMPLRELAGLGGASPETLAKLDKTTLNDIMAIYDPAFHQRTATMMHVMMHEMGGLMNQIEPAIRDGLAQAYAAKFTDAQLAEMNRFFETPTGNAYASNALLLQMDPAVMGKMQAFMPMMVKALPDIMKKASDANAALPKPRTWDEMTPAEHSRLAKLLGVPEADLAAKAKDKTK